VTDYLTLDDVLAAAEAHLGRPADVGDYGLLESAIARPQSTVFGEDAYPVLHEKAAALLQSLATNHALIDGNKRTAFVATALFYEFNGHRIPAEAEDELFDLVIAVATRELDTVQKIAERLAALVR
jgi:death-on-curing protein